MRIHYQIFTPILTILGVLSMAVVMEQDMLTVITVAAIVFAACSVSFLHTQNSLDWAKERYLIPMLYYIKHPRVFDSEFNAIQHWQLHHILHERFLMNRISFQFFLAIIPAAVLLILVSYVPYGPDIAPVFRMENGELSLLTKHLVNLGAWYFLGSAVLQGFKWPGESTIALQLVNLSETYNQKMEKIEGD